MLALVKAQKEPQGIAWYVFLFCAWIALEGFGYVMGCIGRFLGVYMLEIDPESHVRTMLHITRPMSIRITSRSYSLHVASKGPLVVVTAGHQIYIAN